MGRKKYKFVAEIPMDCISELEQHVIDTIEASVGSGRKTDDTLHIYRVKYEGETVLAYTYKSRQKHSYRGHQKNYYFHFILDDEGEKIAQKKIVASVL